MTLRVACEHGRYDSHDVTDINTTGYWECPGGREPTVEEVTQWLKERGYVPLDVQAFGETWDRATAAITEEEQK